MSEREAHRWVVDAIEEGVAAIEEDGQRLVHVPVWALPAGTREGDVLRVSATGDAERVELLVVKDDAARDAALARSAARERPRNPKDEGGPIRL